MNEALVATFKDIPALSAASPSQVGAFLLVQMTPRLPECPPKEDLNVKFYHRKAWLSEKNSKKGFTGGQSGSDSNANSVSKSNRYLEEADGTVISRETFETMGIDARHAWQTVYDVGRAPSAISECGADVWQFFEGYMLPRHPQFTYGRDNWKLLQFATDNYPSWASNRNLTRGKLGVKKEDAGSSSKPLKRSHSTDLDDGDRSSKKLKPDELQPRETTTATSAANELSEEPLVVRSLYASNILKFPLPHISFLARHK